MNENNHYSHINLSDYEWDVEKNICDIQEFFSEIVKNRFSKQYEIFADFFENMISKLTYLCFLPGLKEYDSIIDTNTRDFWVKYSKMNKESILEKLLTYLPESSQFIRLYSNKINDVLGDALNGHPEEAFKLFIQPFLRGYFFSSGGFEKSLLQKRKIHDWKPLFSKKRRKIFLKKKLLICKYVSITNIIQCSLYLTELEIRIRKITGYQNFYRENFVFLCELYRKSPKSIYKYISKSWITPIFIQFSSMRYDIIFKGKIYYCNHYIMYYISVWLLLLYFHCNVETYTN